jgi:hypothetical protein
MARAERHCVQALRQCFEILSAPQICFSAYRRSAVLRWISVHQSHVLFGYASALYHSAAVARCSVCIAMLQICLQSNCMMFLAVASHVWVDCSSSTSSFRAMRQANRP